MKNSIILIIAAIGMAGCSNFETINEKNNGENAMLAKDVTVYGPIVIDNQETPEFTKNFDRLVFFQKVYDIAITEKTPVYYGHKSIFKPFGDTLDLGAPLNPEEIDALISGHADTFAIDLNLMKEIYFWEKWSFNIDNCKLSKTTLGWTPIKVWMNEGNPWKKLMFYIYPKNPSKGKLIAKDLISETSWFNKEPTTLIGFDPITFLTNIVPKLKNGKITAYDPIYLVDKSKRQLTVQELEENIGIELNPLRLNKQMNSILFQEDWYFDETTLGITKDVKSIALIGRDHENDKKKILFFLFPKE